MKTAQQLADELGVDTRTIKSWTEKGIIKARALSREKGALYDNAPFPITTKDVAALEERVERYRHDLAMTEIKLREQEADLKVLEAELRDRSYLLSHQNLLTKFLRACYEALSDGADERERYIFMAYLKEGSRLEIAKSLGMTPERLRQITCEILVRLARQAGIVKQTQAEIRVLRTAHKDGSVVLANDPHLSVRARNVLARMHITTLEELSRVDPATLMNERNCGQRTLRELANYLRQSGY